MRGGGGGGGRRIDLSGFVCLLFVCFYCCCYLTSQKTAMVMSGRSPPIVLDFYPTLS